MSSAFAVCCVETYTHLIFRKIRFEEFLVEHSVIVFPCRSWADFASLQSVFHTEWAARFGIFRNYAYRYSTKRCARTFPLPATAEFDVGSIGQEYHDERERQATAKSASLTKIHARLNDRAHADPETTRLRDLQVQMDQAVAGAYGWGDLDLGHGFHEARPGVRFTISEAARLEALDRLLALNHKR
jgi:hypothetical protein